MPELLSDSVAPLLLPLFSFSTVALWGGTDDAAGCASTSSSEALLEPVKEFACEEDEADCCSENWSTQLAPSCEVDPSICADWECDKSEKVSFSVLRGIAESTAIPVPEPMSEEGAGTTNSRLEERESSEGGTRGDVGVCNSGCAYGFGG